MDTEELEDATIDLDGQTQQDANGNTVVGSYQPPKDRKASAIDVQRKKEAMERYDNLKKDFEELKATVTSSKETNEALRDMNSNLQATLEAFLDSNEAKATTDTEKDLQSQLRDLRSQRQAALKAVNLDAVDSIEDEIYKVRRTIERLADEKATKAEAKKADPEPTQTGDPDGEAAVVAITQLPWWKDDEIRRYAIGLDNELKHSPSWVNLPTRSRLAFVQEQVEKKFNGRKPGATTTEGGTFGTGTTTNTTGTTFDNEAIDIAKKMGIPEDKIRKQLTLIHKAQSMKGRS